MSTKKIFLIRHGQTDYNLKGIVQGSGVDTSLNETGISQASAFYNTYKSVPFKKVYTSSLKRSIQSVQGFIDDGIPWEAYPQFNEISWGTRDGKLVTSEENNYYLQVVNEWKKGNVDLRPEGGESPRDVENRIREVIKIIADRPDEDVILICMHGRAMRILLASIVHEDLTCMDIFQHDNLCLYVLNYNSGKFFIERANDREHLEKQQC